MAKKLNLRVVSFNREIFIAILINFAFASSLDTVIKIKKKVWSKILNGRFVLLGESLKPEWTCPYISSSNSHFFVIAQDQMIDLFLLRICVFFVLMFDTHELKRHLDECEMWWSHDGPNLMMGKSALILNN